MYFAYYEKNSKQIEDIIPKDIDVKLNNAITQFWNQDIVQDILIFISQEQETTITDIKKNIGHSQSTIYEIVNKLEHAKLITTEISYVGSKKRIIKPTVHFITKNKKSKIFLQKFFQGLWVNSSQFKKIMEFLQKNPHHAFTAEEISLKTSIPVDEITILMNNWESPLTKTYSDLFKEPPFEKKVTYQVKTIKRD